MRRKTSTESNGASSRLHSGERVLLSERPRPLINDGDPQVLAGPTSSLRLRHPAEMYNVIARVTMRPKLNRNGDLDRIGRNVTLMALLRRKRTRLRAMRSTFAGAVSFGLAGRTGSS
jgi:hypothetical protein